MLSVGNGWLEVVGVRASENLDVKEKDGELSTHCS
jgi:hypothetical protein